MTRAVLDTKTWVSGLGWGGPPGEVVEAALAGRFEIVTSPALLDELRRVLAYPKLAEMFGDVNEVVRLIALASHIVRPALTRDLVRDPDDNRVLEAAIAGNAHAARRCRREARLRCRRQRRRVSRVRRIAGSAGGRRWA